MTSSRVYLGIDVKWSDKNFIKDHYPAENMFKQIRGRVPRRGKILILRKFLQRRGKFHFCRGGVHHRSLFTTGVWR